ncbi:GPO family capsid scaffolding protein [Aeromonas sp. R6-2]|uniref:GPO family capsid scaffolding protein n=1 Tax=unclassified Aeromonas TaxID=257493 RepID=UPI0034A4D2CF
MSTPNDSQLRTGWVCIATEGKAVDGRDITRQWLVDMAETYDPSFYTALLWPDHDRWSAVGTVQALKTEEVDGKLKLFAILSPTRDLIYYNQVGQYQFCSIEPFENFADTGRTYLLGLGVTDQPASTGTTQLKFSTKHQGHAIGTSEPLDLSGFSLPKEPGGFLKKLFSLLANHGEELAPLTPPHSHDDEDEAMKPEQFTQLTEALNGLGSKFESLAESVATFTAGNQGTDEQEKPAPKPAATEAVTAEQFSQLTEAMTGMASKLDGITQTIEQFSAEKPGQRPSPLGGNDNITLV